MTKKLSEEDLAATVKVLVAENERLRRLTQTLTERVQKLEAKNQSDLERSAYFQRQARGEVR